MSFQTTVGDGYSQANIGEVSHDGPVRASPAILVSTSAANNVIGRAARYTGTSNDTEVSCDVAAGAVFAGIISTPKNIPLSADLTPTLAIPNNSNISVVDMGFMTVDLSQDSPVSPRRNIGDNVWFQNTTGILVGVDSSVTTVAGYTQVPNCKIVKRNIADGTPGLAYIKLTN